MERIVIGSDFTFDAVPGATRRDPSTGSGRTATRPASSDREAVVDTVIAEAGGEGRAGMQAVANVIKNRAEKRGQSPADVVRAPHQFEGYGKKIDPNQRAEAEQIVAGVFNDQLPDITGGADHFHSGAAPDWAGKMPKTAKIGGHTFYAEDGGGEQLGIDRQTTASVPRRERPFKANWATVDRIGDPRSPDWQKQNLVTIQPVKGQSWTVYRPAAEAFSGLIRDLEAEGYPVSSSGGFNYRNIRGSDKLSQHAFGTAIDINAAENPMMKGRLKTDLPANIREIAARHGLKWGGDFKNRPDPMHFEYVGEGGDDAITTASIRGEGGMERIIVNEDYKPEPDTMGDIPGVANFDPMASIKARKQTTPIEVAAPGTDVTADPFAQLNAQRVAAGKKPLIAMPASKYDKWKTDWEAQQPGIIGDLVNSFKIGMTEDNPAAAGATLEAFGDAYDIETLSGVGKSISDWSQQGETAARPRVTDYAQIRTDSVGNMLSDAAHYAAATLGSAAASTIPSLVGGVAGGAIGGAAGAPAAGVGAVPGAGIGATIGAIAGAAGPSYVLNAGDVYKSIRDDPAIQAKIASGEITKKEVARISLGAAVPIAALDVAGVDRLLKIGAKPIKEVIYKRIAKGIAEGSITEGGTEGLQQAIQEGVQDVSGGSRTAGEQVNAIVNSALGGALFGGVAGGGEAATQREQAAPGTEPPPGTEQPPPGAQPPTAPGTGPPPGGAPPPVAGAAAATGVAPKGPLESAVAYGEGELQRTTAEAQKAAEARTPPGAPPIGVKVTVASEGQNFTATVTDYAHNGDAVVHDPVTGEILQIPVTDLTVEQPPLDLHPQRDEQGNIVYGIKQPAALPAPPAPVAPGEVPAPAEPGPTEVPPAEPKAGEVTSTLPPREAQKPALDRFPSPPDIGQSVIVDAPGIMPRTPARIESYEGNEAVVRLPNGSIAQIPLEHLYVDKRTKAEVAAAEEAPPVARPRAEGPTIRQVLTPKGEPRTLDFPDDLHARLYDLGQQRTQAKRLGGVSQLDLDQVNPTEQQRLADELRISAFDAGQLADDYRFHAQRHAGTARSDLPQKMFKYPEKRLQRARREFAATKKAAEQEAPTAPAPAAVEGAVAPTAAAAPADLEAWWDRGLTPEGRRRVLERAGVKRSRQTLWRHFPINLQSKIAAVQPAMDHEFAAEAAPAPLDVAANEAATSPQNGRPEPTQPQKEAGNYKKGHVSIGGLDISIENPEGSTREGVSPSGKAWKRKLKSHYGYIRGTVGRDKDHIDVFIKKGTDADSIADDSPVFVVDQVKPTNHHFDEHKVMLGYADEEEARAAYLENYTMGWRGLGAITPATLGDLKAWLSSGDTKRPFVQRFTGDMATVPGQESAKRLLEIAAIGGHQVRLVGDQEAGAELAAAFPTIGGDPQQIATRANASLYPAGEIRMDVPPISEADRLRPVGETSAKISARVEQGRANLAAVQGTDPNAEKLITDASKHGFTDAQITTARELARSIAASDGAGSIGRVHIAEALSYVMPTAAEASKAPVPKPAKPKPAAPEKSVWTEIGVNADGNPVFEDQRGVRSYTKNGIRISETVGIVPGGGITLTKPRDPEFETAAPAPQLQAGPYPNEGKTPIGEHAKTYVVENGRRTGNEWTVAFDGQGRTRLHQQGTRTNSGTPPEFFPTLLDPSADLVVHHNHPRSTTLSTPDALALLYPGLSGLWAHGHDGTSSHIQLSEDAAKKLKARRAAMTKWEDANWLRDIFRDQLAPPIEAATHALVKARVIAAAERHPLNTLMKMAALDRANFADWMTDIPIPASWERPEIQQAIEKAANDTAQALYQSPGRIRDGRRALFFRQPGDLAGVLGGDRGRVGRRPAEAVLAGGGEAPAGGTPGTVRRPVAPAPDEFAGNKIFTQDKVDAAWATLKAKLGKKPGGLQEPEAIDPDIMVAGMTIAGAYIERGVRDFAAFAQSMIDTAGDGIKPYLLSFWEGARNYPHGIDVSTMTPVPESKQQHAALMAPAPAPAPAGEFGTPENPNEQALGKAYGAFFADPANSFSTIVQARKFAEDRLGGPVKAGTPAAKQVDEAVELGVVIAARDIVRWARHASADPPVIFDALLDLYGRQPKLGVRTSTSIENQAYSTPAPLAFVASNLAEVTYTTSVLEPTAGNGMLLIEANPARATVNELDPGRAANLEAQGFRPTQKDAATENLRHAGYPVDVVIANPPFGVVKDEQGASKTFQVAGRYATNEVDHAIAFNALSNMRDDGSAVLLVGGPNKLANTPEARSNAYNGKAKRQFYYHLYNGYNVVDHFTVAGELYERQGAGWPIDVIVIRGRGKSAKQLPAADPPRMVNSWAGVKELLDADYVSPTAAAGKPAGEPAVRPPAGGPAGGDGRPGGPVRPVGPAPAGVEPEPSAGPEPAEPGPDRGQPGTGGAPVERSGEPEAGAAGEEPGEPGRPRPPAVKPAAPVDTTERQIPYEPKSGAGGMNTLVPVNMKTSTQAALDELEQRVGNLDTYVAKELGYKKSDLGKYFGAEQIDGIALAIDNIKRGAGLIIGDQTGIGKGRQVAAVLSWAKKHGKTPIFVTEMPSLYADMFRDLEDIGVKDPKIFMTNTAETIRVDDEGKRFLKSKPGKAQLELIGKMTGKGRPIDHDFVFTTYSQMQTVKGKETERMALLRALAPNAIIVFDESHNAGGTEEGQRAKKKGAPPNRAEFARQLVNLASGVLYSSATYAKRPSVMDLYSKTDMRLAVPDLSKLGETIGKGGVPMQQVVAAMLSRAGQYLRRERSFDGVQYNTSLAEVDKDVYENFSESVHLIQVFSEKHVRPAASGINDGLKNSAGNVTFDGSTGAAGAQSSNFTSVLHNLIAQMLLSIKADTAADTAIAAAKAGEKPIITVSNTMESFIEQVAADTGLKPGDATDINFRDLLLRYLERSRMIMIKDVNGDAERHYLTDDELGPAGVAAYNRTRDYIENGDFGTLPASPIDWMKHRLKAAGLKVGEITGREKIIDYRADGQGVLRTRSGPEMSTSGKIKARLDFNNGNLDVLILNRAGATGVSLHASERFKDQRKRHMIIAQAEGNIDTHMQMLGRVHRTGQVVTPVYSQLVADVPAEKRPAAVLARKMASLNANTTASRGSALTAKDTPDFMNEFGDQVAASVMGDNLDLHARMGNPLKYGTDGFEDNDAMRKLTGRIPLLKLQQQEELYDLLGSEYDALLRQLEASGQNTLEAKTLPLDARTIEHTQVREPTADSSSPFADGVWVDKVNVNLLGKPMSSSEVLDQVRTGVGWTDVDEAMHSTTGDPVAAYRRLWQAGYKEMADIGKKALADFKAYKQAALDELSQEARKPAETRLDDIQTKWDALADVLTPGAGVKLMTDEGNFYGIVTEVVKTGTTKNPLALGAWKARLAMADASRELTLPFSQLYTQQTAPTTPSPRQIEVANVDSIGQLPMITTFDDMQVARRENRYITTGNLLAGYEYGDNKGSIINYTDDQGQVRQGILQPKDFDLDKHQAAKPVRFTTGDQVWAFLKQTTGLVKSVDQGSALSMVGNVSYGNLRVATPASKAQGGKYFLDPGVRDAAGRDFVSSGNLMRMDVDRARAPAVIDALMKAGAIYETDSYKDQAKAIVEAKPTAGGLQEPGVEPVARLTGRELVDDFAGPQDMRALRKAAAQWYDKNLLGSPATMSDGTVVRFNRRGRDKTAYGGAGDILLRSVPAIRSIIEQGRVVLRQPGNKPHVTERLVIAAPVELDGVTHKLAVSVHQTADGHFHYDFTFDTGAGEPRIARGGAAAPGSLDALSDISEGPPGTSGEGSEEPSIQPAERPSPGENIGTAAGKGKREPGGFSEPPASETISKEKYPSEKSFIKAIKSRLKSGLTRAQPHLLGAVYLNYFPELAQANMKSVAEYVRVKRKMDAFRGKKHAEMDEIAQEWSKYARLGRAKAEQLADLMHDATIAGVDPDSMDDVPEAKQADYDELRARFLAMAPAGQDIYRKVRDAYARQADELDGILLRNFENAQGIAARSARRELQKELAKIQKSKLSDQDKLDRMREASEKHDVKATRSRWSTAARITRLRRMLESNRVTPPYFPLGRFGKYFVAVRDAEGNLEAFALRETPGARDQLYDEYQAKYPDRDLTKGKLNERDSAAGEIARPSFIADIEKMLPEGTDDTTRENNQRIMDQIWQRYLRSLPELSTRKKAIHRTKLPGFDRDALKVFGSHMFHAAHQMARLKHGLELSDANDEVKKEGQEAPDKDKGAMLADELGKRHQWVMNPQGSAGAQFASTAAFSYYLAASPAAALVNTLQTPMVGIPMLAARFNSGYAAAASEILKASRNVFGNNGLSDTEVKAIKKFEELGLIDRTQSHDLAGVGETGVAYNPLRAKVMAAMSYMFHKAEVANRRVTALAAYRMARAKGMTDEQAIDTAADVTWRTHFDYSNSSRPRFMQKDWQKVAFALRSYQVNMLYRLGRDLHQMFKGATPAARKEARTQFAGMIAMQALFAGATGVAGYNTAFLAYGVAATIASALTGGGDDGDDPFDTEVKFRQAVLDLLGPQLGGIVLNGLPGHYLGIDLTSRVGMPDLWFRSPNKDFADGRDRYYYLLDQVAGAPFGIIKQVLQGYDALTSDQKLKALEAVSPKVLKDLAKAGDYAWQGLTNWNGEPIISPENVDYWDLIAQTAGFTPARIAEAWDKNSALKNAEAHVKEQRQSAINSYAMAFKMGDTDGMQDAVAAIRRFNSSPTGRTMPITGQTLQRSMKNRAILAAKRERGGGVLIQNEALGQLLREELPQDVYQ